MFWSLLVMAGILPAKPSAPLAHAGTSCEHFFPPIPLILGTVLEEVTQRERYL